MRLFVDENLSPRLVSVAHDHGYDATCARDRGLLGAPDHEILVFCIAEDRVCVTNNADDFRDLVGSVETHPGLVVLPDVVRDTQFQLFVRTLESIEQRAQAVGQAPRDIMLNRVLEVDATGGSVLYELPAP